MAEAPNPNAQPEPIDPRDRRLVDRYWRRNVWLMTGLLAIWAVVSLGFGVLFADALNAWRLGGFPLGFWFAQQGSILVFVVLIFVYAVTMSRLDRQHHAELEQAHASDEADARR